MKKLIIAILLLTVSTVFAQRKTKNLVVITLDGYRWQELFRGADSAKLFKKGFFGQDSVWKVQKYWASTTAERRQKLMPFFWSTIAKQGQLYGNRDLGNFVNVTNPHWVSHAGYSEMFTGFVDPKTTNGSPNNQQVSVFEFLNQQSGYKGKIAAFTSWDEYPRIFNIGRSKFPLNSGWTEYKEEKLTDAQKILNQQQKYLPKIFGTTERLDANTYFLATEYIKQKHPQVFYLAFIDTDAFAHRWQYDFYLDAAHNIDDMIANLWAYLQSDPFYKDNTTLIITTDHGRGQNDDWNSHHVTIPHSDEIWIVAIGPDIKPLGEVKISGQLYQKQIAKTLAAILGFDFTGPNPKGDPIESMLNK